VAAKRESKAALAARAAEICRRLTALLYPVNQLVHIRCRISILRMSLRKMEHFILRQLGEHQLLRSDLEDSEHIPKREEIVVQTAPQMGNAQVWGPAFDPGLNERKTV